jgi:hypothetical protein
MANNRIPRIDSLKVVDLTTLPPTMRWVSIIHDVGRPVALVRAPAVVGQAQAAPPPNQLNAVPVPPRGRGRPAKRVVVAGPNPPQ